MLFRKIISRFSSSLAKLQGLSKEQWKAVNSIIRCRTPALGAEVERCDCCSYEKKRYHSCRNRHCPICQGERAREWIEKQQSKLLPVSYFHVVFTVPEELNTMFRYNSRVGYDLLFRIGAETLQTFFKDKLGGRGGFFGVLHTWGQLLQLHPHIHWVVPNGAVNEDGQWISPKRRDGNKFLFPVRQVSLVFRGKLLEALEKLYNKGKLNFPDEASRLRFRDELNMAGAKRWQVYAKRPFAGPEQVIEYLSRYTHRIAISPSRIVEVSREKVTFTYRSRSGEKKTTSFDGVLFLKRFLQHVLPYRFRKIRHYGWYNSQQFNAIKDKLMESFRQKAEFAKCLASLALNALSDNDDDKPSDCCPHCKGGTLHFHHRQPPDPTFFLHEFG